MEPSDAAAQETIERVVGAGVAGRAVVVLVTAVRGAGPMVAALNEMGAARVLVVAAGEGTGPPLDGAVRRIVLGHRATTMTQEVLAAETMTNELTADQHASLDAFDPDRTALVLGMAFTTSASLGDRAIAGRRRPEWADLEDKGTVDGLLAAADVATPTHEVTGPDGVAAAASRLDRGDGVVVAAGGRNGGAELVRWVASPSEARRVTGEMDVPGARGPGLGLFRVAPFVEGVPCSIGAVVTADGVAVLRSVENLVLRDGRRFLYSGVSSVYDPPVGVQRSMAEAARRVGEELRRRVGYRGAFSVDGIVTAAGWRATEVNTRASGGFGMLKGLTVPVGLLNAAIVEGWDDGALTSAVIESTLRPLLEADRALRLVRVLPALPPGTPASVAVCIDGQTARVAADGEEPDGELLVGRAATGAVVMSRVAARPGAGPTPGPSAGPLAVALLDLADRLWSTGTAGLTAAGGTGAG